MIGMANALPTARAFKIQSTPICKGVCASMRGKKVCVLGDFAVGKTSLIRRFVNDVFCEDYQATLGVRIDSKSINLAGLRLDLVL
jgi:GTPase SAR1 family protein